jgi:GNAT superfamily N-acetyltransferase/nitroimidazol reductase NimA-like FMN-containing flavoprotein (pyridoxamine 5'-phosphate oxidase superfamily)
MRRTDKQRPNAEAWRLFAQAPLIHLTAVGPDGLPVLRALHGVVHQDILYFHGADLGEKATCVGQTVVACAERIVAEIPSHWTHPERACPATTFFRSAMVHGTLARVEDVDTKAVVLQTLMERFQPQGGFRPITDEPMYAKAIRSVGVYRIDTARVSAKAALGQKKNKGWRTRALQGLWQSGQLKAFRELSGEWELPLWPIEGGGQVMPLGPEHAESAFALLRNQYWNGDIDDASLRKAQAGGTAWVGAMVGGRLIATARAIGDGMKLALILDVAVTPEWRGRGIGTAVLRVLLDHPAIRDCVRVQLHTKDAGSFYEGLGFQRYENPEWRRSYRLKRSA